MSIDRLNAEDRLMLEADVLWPQDVGALAILDGAGLFDAAGAFRIDAVREAMAARLHLVPRFRQVIHTPRRGLGGPLWRDAADFDLRRHVRVSALPSPAGEADLLHAAAQLRRQRLDRARPLWEMWFLTGLPRGQVGLFVRFHHAIADGRAALTMLAAFLDMAPDQVPTSPLQWTPLPLPPARALLADNMVRRVGGVAGAMSVLLRPRSTLAGIRTALSATRELLGEKPVPRTSFNRLVGPERRLALIRTDLATIKRIGHEHGATTNDVLLSAAAGGLRALLLSRGEPVGLTMRTYVPVSLRRRLRGTTQGNLISQMVVHLPLAEADPGRRLRHIAAETREQKQRARPSMGLLFRLAFVRRLLMKVLARQRVNSTMTTVHGPKRPLHLAGARLVELFPVLNLFGNETLGVGALSYTGAFDIGVVCDADTYPDLDVFVAGVRSELDALCAFASRRPASLGSPKVTAAIAIATTARAAATRSAAG